MNQKKLSLPIHWILVLAVAAVFIPWWAMTGMRERTARLAVELHTSFTQPRLEFRFSKRISYDPQTFVGRGRVAGFWDWTPEGLVLTEKGSKFFRDDGPDIAAALVMGRRQITTIRSVQNKDGGRDTRFVYNWKEVSEPAAKLLSSPPHAGADYEGEALLAEESGVWRVKSLSTPDYEKPVAILLKQATGALR